GRRLAEEFPQAETFAIDADAGHRARDVHTGLDGLSFTLDSHKLRSPLRGRFNVYNVIGAVLAAGAVGVPDDTIAAAVERAGRVPGRFEAVDEGQDFAVIVDYAHTPDSLENVLRA